MKLATSDEIKIDLRAGYSFHPETLGLQEAPGIYSAFSKSS
jgi:hypothetical protein